MSTPSDLISSFLDHQDIHDQQQQQQQPQLLPSFASPINTFPSNDMYNLLLHTNKNDIYYNRRNINTDALSNDNLKAFNIATSNNNASSNSISTINPRQLNSHKGSITSSSASNSDFDNISEVSSDEESTFPSYITTPRTSVSSSSSSSRPSAAAKRTNNWAMNVEFNDAINTWIIQNEKAKKLAALQAAKLKESNSTYRARASTMVSVPVSHSVSTNQTYQRTSASKRRKSEPQIPQLPNHTSSLSSFPASSSSSSTTASRVSSRSPSVSKPSSSLSSSITSTSRNSSNARTKQPLDSALELTGEEDEEEKPFKCNDCPKAFRRSEHLKRHVRSVHSNVRPFPCKFCEKKFSRSDNLAQHLRTHARH